MKRIEYIDAMRGLAILLVVIGHVLLFSFHDSQSIYFTVLNGQLEIPLFLMISGFFMNKPIESWTREKIFGVLKNKFIPLVVTPIAFMLLFSYISDYNIKSAFFDYWKNGYWFTITLFEFLLVYFCLIGISKLLRLTGVWYDVFIVAASIVIMYVGVLFNRYETQYSFIGLFNLVHFTKFVYFVYGVMCAKYFEKLCRLFDSNYLMGGGIMVFFLLCAYSFKDGGMRYLGSSTFYFMVLTLFGIFIIFAAFRKYMVLSTSSKVGRCLQYIGKYTLDIYFIHYFFIPRNLHVIGDFFVDNPNPIVSYTLAVAVSVIVIATSLMMSKIIRLSPALAHWVFGAK